MNKIFFLLASVLALVVPATSSAALSSAMGGIAGTYEVYDGRLAGWLNTTDGDWLMFTNPNVSDTLSLTGTVSTYPGDLSTTRYQNPVLYSRAIWVLDHAVSNLSWGPGMPANASAQLNAAIWNIFEPGSVPLYEISGDPYEINWWYTQAIAGYGDNWSQGNYAWFLTTQSGNEVLGLYGASLPPPTSAPSVPLPPAVWLFGSGLMGLVAIARSKKSA